MDNDNKSSPQNQGMQMKSDLHPISYPFAGANKVQTYPFAGARKDLRLTHCKTPSNFVQCSCQGIHCS